MIEFALPATLTVRPMTSLGTAGSVRGGLRGLRELKLGRARLPTRLGRNGPIRLRSQGTPNYSGDAGLLWAMNGARLVQLYQTWAVLEVPVNRSERIFHRRNVDPAKICP
jgi:hypothetical protein